LDTPVATISEALSLAGDGWLIFVAEGTYPESIIVADDGVEIRGENAEDTTIDPNFGADRCVTVDADDVTLRNLTIRQCRVGVAATTDSPIGQVDNLLLEGVFVEAIANLDPGTASGPPEPAIGILLDGTNNAIITGGAVSLVTGGAGYNAAPGEPGAVGGDAVGIRIIDSPICAVTMVQLAVITGGQGGGGASGGVSGTGGWGRGLHLSETTGCTISDLIIEEVFGGEGGSCTDSNCVGGTGGMGAGIAFDQDAVFNILFGTSMDDLNGGQGGSGAPTNGLAQTAYGLHLAPGSEDNLVASDNTLDNGIIHYITGDDGTTIANAIWNSPANPTNLGHIVVLNATNVSVVNPTVSGGTAPAGNTATGTGGEAGVVRGILLQNCNGCFLSGANVGPLSAGPGGAGTDSGGNGGQVEGVTVLNSDNVNVAFNLIHDLTGGPGGPGGTAGGNGGTVYGLRINNSTSVFPRRMIIDTLESGDANTAGATGPRPGRSIALALELSSFVEVRNIGMHTINLGASSQPQLANVAGCVTVADSSSVDIAHISCVNAGSGVDGWGRGVVVFAGQSQPVAVSNSIISSVSGICWWNAPENAASSLGVSYSIQHACGASEALNATLSPTVMSTAPFMNSLDFTVQADSPAIDAGNPVSTCSDEPEPNGCRVNIGTHGNTELATPSSNGNTPHCPICPGP